MRPRSHGQAHRNGVPPPGNHRPGSPHASMRPGEGLTRTPESSAARGGSREMRAGFRAGSERAGAHWPARLPGTPAAGSHRCWSAGSGPACRGTWPRERRGRAAGAAGEWMRPSRSDRSRAGRAAQACGWTRRTDCTRLPDERGLGQPSGRNRPEHAPLGHGPASPGRAPQSGASRHTIRRAPARIHTRTRKCSRPRLEGTARGPRKRCVGAGGGLAPFRTKRTAAGAATCGPTLPPC